MEQIDATAHIESSSNRSALSRAAYDSSVGIDQAAHVSKDIDIIVFEKFTGKSD